MNINKHLENSIFVYGYGVGYFYGYPDVLHNFAVCRYDASVHEREGVWQYPTRKGRGYLSVPPTRQHLTPVFFILGMDEGCRVRAETRAQLDNASSDPMTSSVNYASNFLSIPTRNQMTLLVIDS